MCEYQAQEIKNLSKRIENQRQELARLQSLYNQEVWRANFYEVRSRRLDDALTELVTLKDKVKDADPDDYERRKPLAWEAARKAIGWDGDL